MTLSPSHLPGRGGAPVAWALATVAAFALAGCSGGGGQESPAAPTSEETSSLERPAGVVEVDPVQAVQDAVTATIEVEALTIESELELAVGSEAFSLRTQGGIDYASTVADLMVSVNQDDVETALRVLSDGESLWVSLVGPEAPTFPEDAIWLQGDAQRLADATTFTTADLLGAVLVLRGATEVDEVGTDEVDGVSVTRYETTFAYDEATAAVSGEEADTLENAFSLSGDAASAELEVEVAIGEDGVIREVDLAIVKGGAVAAVAASGSYKLGLGNVNGEIDGPEAPDQDDVATGPDADALLSQIIT